jgi:hypothetical protein
MFTENLKSAIETWQKEDAQKRAIMVIAIEEKEQVEDTTHCETAVAVMGGSKLLVEAVKAARKNGGVVNDLFNKADMSMLLEKLCR